MFKNCVSQISFNKRASINTVFLGFFATVILTLLSSSRVRVRKFRPIQRKGSKVMRYT